MLVLGRKPGELIDLIIPPSDKPTKVAVGVTKANGVKCWIGVEAPREVEVWRREITEEKAAK